MFRSNLSNLVADAFRHGEASASDRKWQAFRFGGIVGVWHYDTRLFDVTCKAPDGGGRVVPVDPGWGSASDRAGVRRITDGWGCSVGYRELFEETRGTVAVSAASVTLGRSEAS
jgi:hypothetical protein